MNASWPTDWQGQTYLDCGADEQILTLVSTPSLPNGIHQKSFQLIVEQWDAIWPEFQTVVIKLMDQYKQDPPDWSAVSALHVELSDVPIAEDAEWSLGIVFSASATLWTLPYRGWSAVPSKAQAIW